MVARDGFTSLEQLPRDDVDWVPAFLEAPTQVFLHAIAIRLLAEVRPAKGAADSASLPTCAPNAAGTDPSAQSFSVRTRYGERTWTFGWEQQRWKLVRGSLSSAKRRESFFRENGVSKGPRKKWTPSFK
jgi:hypothetical protein